MLQYLASKKVVPHIHAQQANERKEKTITLIFRIKEIAEQQGLNVTNLAKKAGISKPTAIGLWHNHVLFIKIETLQKVALALGCSLRELFTEDAERQQLGNNLLPLVNGSTQLPTAARYAWACANHARLLYCSIIKRSCAAHC